MSTIRSGHQIVCKVTQCPILSSRRVSDQIPTRQLSSYWSHRGKKKKEKSCGPVNVSHLPSDKYGNRCAYHFALNEPKRSWFSRLFRRGSRQVPLPTNYCPSNEPKECQKKQVYWFGFERDEIDELCNPKTPPLHTCRKQQKLMAEECGCLPPAQLCDPTRFHYPGMCIIRETYSTEPLVYRRCEPKPRPAPKPDLPPAVKCIKMACSFQRWLPLSEERPKTAAAMLQVAVDPYDEFNYPDRQQRPQQSAELVMKDFCTGNVS